MCVDIRNRYSDYKCILYDDTKCDGRKGATQLSNDETLFNVENSIGFGVESVSIRKGCQLTLYTGNSLILYVNILCQNVILP